MRKVLCVRGRKIRPFEEGRTDINHGNTESVLSGENPWYWEGLTCDPAGI